MAFALVTALHLLAFLGCFLGSAGKNLILRRATLSPAQVLRLVQLDRITGGSALLVLATGLALVFAVGAPPMTYLGSGVFWVKIALFAAASGAVLSTKPMIRRARALGANFVPEERMRTALLFDLVCLTLIAVLGLVLAGRVG